jgi:hypothetical protein
VTGIYMDSVKIEQHTSTGLLWFAGWLFTWGYLQLGFWQGVLALLVWPYYLGVRIATMLAG